MKKFLTVFILCFLAFHGAPADAVNAAGAERIDYRVDISRPDGKVEVTLELDSDSQSLALEIQDTYGEGLAVDLASHIEGVEAVDGGGEPLAVQKSEGTWLIEGSGRISVSYRVDLSGYEAGSDYLQSLADEEATWPFFPVLEQGLAYLPGYAILLHPSSSLDYPPSLELVLPGGWNEALPWHGQPGSMEELLFNPIFAGDLAIEERGSLLVAAPSSSSAAAGAGLSEYAGKTGSMLAETEGLLDESVLEEGERLLVVLLFSGGEETAVDTCYVPAPFTRSLVLPAGSRANVLSDASIEATARSLAQLLFPPDITLDLEAAWLRLGTAWYLQDLVPYRSGVWGAATFWERFSARYGDYRDARETRGESLAASGAQANQDREASILLCCGGAAACAALDSDLRSSQAFGGDFASFIRDLGQLESGLSPLSNSELKFLLQNTTGMDFSSFFRDYVEGSELLPVSAFSSLDVAEPDELEPAPEGPQGSTSTIGWVLLGLAIGAVFIIPFILEPYTMRPRKPGWLEKIKEE